MSSIATRHSLHLVLCAALLGALTGCETTTATVTLQPGYFTVKPDVIIIRPMAVTLEEARRDQDVIPGWMLRHARSELQLPSDLSEGRVAGDALARYLVAALEIRGIPAKLAADAPPPTRTTGIVTGQFVNAGSAAPNVRPSIGYTIKRGNEARIQFAQGNACVGEVLIEKTLIDSISTNDVDTSAKLAAVKIADVIFNGYVTLGWLPPERK